MRESSLSLFSSQTFFLAMDCRNRAIVSAFVFIVIAFSLIWLQRYCSFLEFPKLFFVFSVICGNFIRLFKGKHPQRQNAALTSVSCTRSNSSSLKINSRIKELAFFTSFVKRDVLADKYVILFFERTHCTTLLAYQLLDISTCQECLPLALPDRTYNALSPQASVSADALYWHGNLLVSSSSNLS